MQFKRLIYASMACATLLSLTACVTAKPLKFAEKNDDEGEPLTLTDLPLSGPTMDELSYTAEE